MYCFFGFLQFASPSPGARLTLPVSTLLKFLTTAMTRSVTSPLSRYPAPYARANATCRVLMGMGGG